MHKCMNSIFVIFVDILLINKTWSLVEISKPNTEHLITSEIKYSTNNLPQNIESFDSDNATDKKKLSKTSSQNNELYKNDSDLNNPMEINNTTDYIIGAINEFLNEDLSNVTSENNTVLNKCFKSLGYLKAANVLNNSNPIDDDNFETNLENDGDNMNYILNNSITMDSLESNESYWVPQETRRIYKGERTKIKHYPFVASVQIFGTFMCAGSIITDELIITAASCLQLAWNNRYFRENPAYLSVRVGSNFYSTGGEVIPVLEVYFHPRYDPRSLNNNLALMRLRRVLRLNRKKHVRKIRIDKEEQALSVNTRGVKILGWGAKTASNKIQDPYQNILSYDVLDVYPLYLCKEVYSKEYLKRTNFCAGYLSKGAGACNRDVGGPGVVNGILVGVISFGSPVCGAIDAPTVFTKLGYYYDWIENIMNQPVDRGKVRTTTTAPPTLFPRLRTPRTTTQKPLTPILITKKKYYYYTDTEDAGTVLRSPSNDDEVLRAIKTLLKRDYIVAKKTTTIPEDIQTTALIPIVSEILSEAETQDSIESEEPSKETIHETSKETNEKPNTKETNEKPNTKEDNTDEHIDFLIRELEKDYDLNFSEHLEADTGENKNLRGAKETTTLPSKFTAMSGFFNDNQKDTQTVHKTYQKKVLNQNKKAVQSKNKKDNQKRSNVKQTEIIAILNEKLNGRKQDSTQVNEDSFEITIGDESTDYGMEILMD